MTNFIFWSLMAVIALAPLPFASNRPWSWSLLSLTVGVLIVLWAVTLFFERVGGPGNIQRRSIMQVRGFRHWPITLVFAGIIVWLALQASLAVPAAFHNPVWSETAAILGVDVTSSISIDPVSSTTAFMRIFAYGGVFWLAMQFGRRSEWALRIFWILCISGTAYALYGLAVHLGGYEKILWYDKWAYLSSLTSTFVNRNSYSTYAGLTLLVTIVLTLREMEHAAPLGLTSRAGILEFLDNISFRLFFLFVATASLAMALLLTQSRGGFASTLIGVVALLLCMSLNRGGSWRKLVGTLAVFSIAGYLIISISGGATLSRLAGTGTGDIGGNRHKILSLSLEALEDAPPLGTGLGTYEDVFHSYRGPDWYVWTPAFDKAHNTYLEFAIEIGVIPTAVLIGLIAFIIVLCLRGVVKRRRSAIYPCAGVAAAVLVGVHSMLDFSMQIPAVAVTFCAILGVAYSQSWGSGDRKKRSHSLPT